MNLRKKFNEKELGILNRIAIDQARKEKAIEESTEVEAEVEDSERKNKKKVDF